MKANIFNHICRTLTLITWLALPFFLAVISQIAPRAAYAESAAEKLTRIVNEVLVLQPIKLGVVKVIITKNDELWTEIQLPFDDLRPEPRRIAASLGWRSNEVVRIRISGDFKEIRICRRDVLDGC
jgi:hypothetical protein